ncbi:MAG: hypothetical protein RIT81_01005 [Deltaproteobacteria bacterium]
MQISAPRVFRDEQGTLLEYDGTPLQDVIRWNFPYVIRCGPVLESGARVAPETFDRLGWIVTRRVSPSAAEEAWSETDGAWQPLTALIPGGIATDALDLGALEFVADDLAYPWQGLTLLADDTRFDRGAIGGGFPSYATRLYFERTTGAPRSVLSPPSLAFPLWDAPAFLAGVDWEERWDPRWIQMFMRRPNRSLFSEVEMHRDGTSPLGIVARTLDPSGDDTTRVVLDADGAVTLTSHPDEVTKKASVELTVDGDVRVDVADGRTLVFDDHLEVRKVGGEVRLRLLAPGRVVIENDVVIERDLLVEGNLKVDGTFQRRHSVQWMP